MWNDIYLAIVAFFAGIVSASVGGGGLLLIPALFNAYPGTAAVTILGTNRLVFGVGGLGNVWRVLRKTPPDWSLVWPGILFGAPLAALGASLLLVISESWYKPVLLVIMILLAIYTFRHKQLGQEKTEPLVHGKAVPAASAGWGGLIGIYLGLIGPAAQSFTILAFVRLFGLDFKRASHHAQILINALNLATLIWFGWYGYFLWETGILMGICSIAGTVVGARFVSKGGNTLVRRLFMLLLIIETGRFAWQLF